jgi:hypothetical protein
VREKLKLIKDYKASVKRSQFRRFIISMVTVVNNDVLHVWKWLKRVDFKCSH